MCWSLGETLVRAPEQAVTQTYQKRGHGWHVSQWQVADVSVRDLQYPQRPTRLVAVMAETDVVQLKADARVSNGPNCCRG